MSDRDLMNVPEYPIHPPVEHTEVIETAEILAEDPTGGAFVLGDELGRADG
ncbi:hypothetical protein GCM10009830_42520 [Glycomyces endophyticus]|uniref:Uncharacterized protein n=1 Tax=Glycomyces endophyticus TaxID=480996 RepID=A0ABN2HMN6_9ACTN